MFTYRRTDHSNVAEVRVLSRRVLHLHDGLSNALQMTQRILQDAIILGSGTVRCHRDDWHHVAVAVIIVVVDDVVVVLCVPRWRGDCDYVVASDIEVIV